MGTLARRSHTSIGLVGSTTWTLTTIMTAPPTTSSLVSSRTTRTDMRTGDGGFNVPSSMVSVPGEIHTGHPGRQTGMLPSTLAVVIGQLLAFHLTMIIVKRTGDGGSDVVLLQPAVKVLPSSCYGVASISHFFSLRS